MEHNHTHDIFKPVIVSQGRRVGSTMTDFEWGRYSYMPNSYLRRIFPTLHEEYVNGECDMMEFLFSERWSNMPLPNNTNPLFQAVKRLRLVAQGKMPNEYSFTDIFK